MFTLLSPHLWKHRGCKVVTCVHCWPHRTHFQTREWSSKNIIYLVSSVLSFFSTRPVPLRLKPKLFTQVPQAFPLSHSLCVPCSGHTGPLCIPLTFQDCWASRFLVLVIPIMLLSPPLVWLTPWCCSNLSLNVVCSDCLIWVKLGSSTLL